jgi:ubiquinone/menaquinone biosynthesis C-methylase UbiE
MPPESRSYWEGEATSFDDAPDHGLRAPETREAWRHLLLGHLPPAPADVIDLGCGTGTLSVLLAESGYRVQGLDVAENMVTAARHKAEAGGVTVTFQRGDAADPPYEAASCDVVLSRHVLWAMPDPSAALRRWIALVRPGGRLLLVEGHWSTGAGLRAVECELLLRQAGRRATVHVLDDPVYWGRTIDDERYVVVSLS